MKEPEPGVSRSGTSAASVGLRVHSGWAVLVALAGPSGKPTPILRRRVELSRRSPRFPFHAAEGQPFTAAERLVGRAADEARTLASAALRAAAEELHAMGHELVASGLLLAAGRPLPGLPQILASHAMIHAAEGELYRDAIRQACRSGGLRVLEIRERDLEALAARSLGHPDAELRRRVAAWGKAMGPPWTQDEKRAALVAWLALGSDPAGRPRERRRR